MVFRSFLSRDVSPEFSLGMYRFFVVEKNSQGVRDDWGGRTRQSSREQGSDRPRSLIHERSSRTVLLWCSALLCLRIFFLNDHRQDNQQVLCCVEKLPRVTERSGELGSDGYEIGWSLSSLDLSKRTGNLKNELKRSLGPRY